MLPDTQTQLQFISTIIDPKLFDPTQKEICTFFINLFELIYAMDAQSSVFWAATSALENAINNSKAKVVTEQFRYLPALTRLLTEVGNQTKISKVLKLIQELTYNIELSWDEPYLRLLIKELLKHMFGEDVTLYCPPSVSLIFTNSIFLPWFHHQERPNRACSVGPHQPVLQEPSRDALAQQVPRFFRDHKPT